MTADRSQLRNIEATERAKRELLEQQHGLPDTSQTTHKSKRRRAT